MEMHLRDGKTSYDADLYYDGAEGCAYAQMFGIWVEMDDPDMRDMAKQMDVFRMLDLSDPAATAIETATYGGKPCTVETIILQDGSTVKLCFQNGSLVRVGLFDSDGSSLWCTVSGFSGKVGMFEKPKHPLKLG